VGGQDPADRAGTDLVPQADQVALGPSTHRCVFVIASTCRTDCRARFVTRTASRVKRLFRHELRPPHARDLEDRLRSVARMPLEGLPVGRPLVMLAEPDLGFVMELVDDIVPPEKQMLAPYDVELVARYQGTGGLRRRLQTPRRFPALCACSSVEMRPAAACRVGLRAQVVTAGAVRHDARCRCATSARRDQHYGQDHATLADVPLLVCCAGAVPDLELETVVRIAAFHVDAFVGAEADQIARTVHVEPLPRVSGAGGDS
jgi:hypothetical protein